MQLLKVKQDFYDEWKAHHTENELLLKGNIFHCRLILKPDQAIHTEYVI